MGLGGEREGEGVVAGRLGPKPGSGAGQAGMVEAFGNGDVKSRATGGSAAPHASTDMRPRFHVLRMQLVVACSGVDDDRNSVFHVWEWRSSAEPASSGIVG